MNNPDESVYLHHMLDAIGRIGRFLEGVDQAAFKSDELVQSAVIYQRTRYRRLSHISARRSAGW